MSLENKTAVFYITKKGLALGQRILELYPQGRILKFSKESVAGLWPEYKNFFFIMATGIVVRTIAGLIKSKQTDPGVIVLDDNGKFAISLLSGHLGCANEIARKTAKFLGGEAVITTASEVNGLPSLDLWAMANNLAIENWKVLPSLGTRLLNNGFLRVYDEGDRPMPKVFIRETEAHLADLIISNKKDIFDKGEPEGRSNPDWISRRLYLRPKNLVIGLGCNRGTLRGEIEQAVKRVLEEKNIAFLSIHSLATLNQKADEAGLIDFAKNYGFPVSSFTAEELNLVEGIEKSETVFRATGAKAVAEPAALLAASTNTLLVPKQKIGNVTVAIAETGPEYWPNNNHITRTEVFDEPGSDKPLQPGRIFIVGLGPGNSEHLTPRACQAIRESDLIVGYHTYLHLIKELIEGKEIFSSGMTREIERGQKAIELAYQGKTVSVISGGDPGIYAMAGLIFELCQAITSLPAISIEVIPGISALNACAARLGAPLMHDFAAISLSDRLTSWSLIEKRLRLAAEADLVIVLYNPKSKGRSEQIKMARDILRCYRHPHTPVGIVKSAMRQDETVILTDLNDVINYPIDMQTTVIIGNSKTIVWKEWMITPRGYKIASTLPAGVVS